VRLGAIPREGQATLMGRLGAIVALYR